MILVRAPIEDVAGAIAEDVVIWERDVLGKVVTLQPDSMFVFQLVGHSWSIVVSRLRARVPYGKIGYEWVKLLSRRLQRPIIEYGTSDTCGTIGYALIVNGEVVEDFYAEDGEFSEDDDVSLPEFKRSHFKSIRRVANLSEIDNIRDFVNNFFIEQDAFEPGIEFDYFFDYDPPPVGRPGEVKNSGHQISSSNVVFRDTPEIERVDYLIWNFP